MGKAQQALDWAITKIGYGYSQAKRWDSKYFDCSSLVYRAFKAAGINLVHKDIGEAVSTSTTEVYAKGFKLLYPASYNQIGKQLPSDKGLLASLNLQPGDIIFYNHKSTDRPNKITHVSMYNGSSQIIHARNPQLGVRYDPLSYMQANVIAVTRYIDDGAPSNNDTSSTDSGGTSFVYRLLKRTDPMMRGDDIRWLQAELNASGHDAGKVDGIFGKNTDAAVRAYQKDKGLVVDGIAGTKTIGALGGKYRG